MQRAPLRHARAFTLIELMVVIAIVAVVLSLAAPSFQKMIEMQRLRGVQDQLVTDLQFARSEAARSGIPVHFYVKRAGGGAGACYILFTDTNLDNRNWQAPCDCAVAAGARCTNATMKEVRTVQLPASQLVLLRESPIAVNHVAFDPVTLGLITPAIDVGGGVPQPFKVDTMYDRPRKLRTIVELSGRPLVCAPDGSTIAITSCS